MADQNIPVTADGSVTIDCDNDNNSTTEAIKFTHNNGTELARIQENGNMGIGTTSPGGKLDVTGSSTSVSTAAKILFTDTAGDTDSRTWAIQNAVGDSPYGTLGFHVGTSSGGSPSNTPKAVIDKSGNVGLGTATPGAMLDVRGNVIINEDGADKDARIEGDTNANLLFTDASTDRVGIGTASPGALLHVNGFARYKVPAASVYHNADQTVAASTTAALNFNSEDFDNDSLHDTATNNSRFTIPEAGVYFVKILVELEHMTSVTTLKLRLNGSTTIAENRLEVHDNYFETMELSIIYQFSANDYVESILTTTTGASADTIVKSSPKPLFQIYKISD
ncbi:MAG: hypothetical protein HY399_01235 [Elusimicrobia bacterium]|nr:hypothetical protein [Elusimicrobiota bacterium]